MSYGFIDISGYRSFGLRSSRGGGGVGGNEERRIVYVGKLPDGMTRDVLRKRFQTFGKIEEISLHFRDHG